MYTWTSILSILWLVIIFFFKETCCLRGEWFLGVDLITYKVAFGKAQFKRCY